MARQRKHYAQRMRGKPVQFPQAFLRDFCNYWTVEMFGIFGSAIRADFRHDSDVDVLVRFRPDSKHTLLDLVRMERELGRELGRRVDLGEWAAVESDFNAARRDDILKTLKVLYETGTRESAGHSARDS